MSITFSDLRAAFTRSPDVFMRTLKLLSAEEQAEMVVANSNLIPPMAEDANIAQLLPVAYHREQKAITWRNLNGVLSLDRACPGSDVLREAIYLNGTLGLYGDRHYAEHLLALAIARIELVNA